MGWVSPAKGEWGVLAIARRRLLTFLVREMGCPVAGVPLFTTSYSKAIVHLSSIARGGFPHHHVCISRPFRYPSMRRNSGIYEGILGGEPLERCVVVRTLPACGQWVGHECRGFAIAPLPSEMICCDGGWEPHRAGGEPCCANGKGRSFLFASPLRT